MHRLTPLALAAALLVAPAALAQDEAVPLSQLARELGSDPARVDAFLARMGQTPGAAGVLTPAQKEAVRAAIKRGDFAFLDRFPSVTVEELGQGVQAANLAKRTRQARRAQGHLPTDQMPGLPLDEAPRSLEEPLGIPTGAPPLAPGSLYKDLGGGLRYGDAVDPDKAARHGDSARLADVLDRLALNERGGAPPFRVTFAGKTAVTPSGLVAVLEASGHTVEVRDARYFANFGDLNYKGRDVATPFWVDSELPVPGTDRTLAVPVTHSQHELIVRGPEVNADVSFFFGIDNEAKFRAMGSKGQSWTGGRVHQRYTGKQAREAIRLAGAIRRAYVKKAKAFPGVGYYPLGVCNDVNAMLELHLSGKTTLYPLTRDLRYFQGPGEVDTLARRLPVDGRSDAEPDAERIFSSLPVDAIDDLAFPALRADLTRFDPAQQALIGPTPGLSGSVQQMPSSD